MTIQSLFFELLQVAVGNRDRLYLKLDRMQWQSILSMSEKQSLAGIALIGVEKLPKEQWPPQDIIFELVGIASQIEQRNAQTSEACQQICEKFGEDGFRCCILKGQANHAYYPQGAANRRSCGDIDVWVKPNVEKCNEDDIRCVLEYLKSTYDLTGLCWLHANLDWTNGVPVEVHFHPSFMNAPQKNRRLQKFFANFEECVTHKEIDGCLLPAMMVGKDLIFQMNHIYRHLIDEGVGLRQILDYYWLLNTWHAHNVNSKEDTMKIIQFLGMKRFAGALMYVLREVFAMPENMLLCPANEKNGKFLLNEIMIAGNFGYNDPRMATLNIQGGRLLYQISHAKRRFRRNMRFFTSYPEEVIWEPFARMYHFAWKKLGLWRV